MLFGKIAALTSALGGMAVTCSLTGPALAASAITTPSVGYTAVDVFTAHSFTDFAVGAAGSVLGWSSAGNSLVQLDAGGNLLRDLGAPEAYGGGNSFVTYNADFTRALVGFTVFGPQAGDDRIYELDLTLGQPVWNLVATFAQNYDAEYVGTDIYVSGKLNTTFDPDNAIWKLDTSGANAHDQILATGGYSAGLAFDAAGNLYYGTNGTGDDKLVFLSATQINSALGAGSLALTDAQILSELGLGAADVAVAPDGEVYLTLPNFSGDSLVIRYDATMAGDEKYAVIGTSGEYLTYLSADELGLYLNGFGVDGLALVTPVPEPLTVGASALLLLLVRRRRREVA